MTLGLFEATERRFALRHPEGYSAAEIQARDAAWLRSPGWNAREGDLWNEAWDAARRHYAPKIERLGALDA